MELYQKIILEGKLRLIESIAEANSQLQQLSFTGASRGDASVTLVTVSDGYSSQSETIYLSVPNTAPIVNVPSTNLSAKIGGVPFSLSCWFF